VRRSGEAIMEVRVLFFGALKDVAGMTSEQLTLPEGSDLGDLLAHYEERLPQLKRWRGAMALSVNQEYAGPETQLRPDDEVGLLPPVSGGTPSAGTLRTEHAAIVRQAINTQLTIATLKQPEDGAAAVFEGIVRNHTRGRQTLYLDYEAYEEMALKQLEALAREALGRFAVRDVQVVHRLGRLEIGETSVLIVVVSAHREAAFEACRWLIDTLKKTVPIWKKEYFVDGAVWAYGQPFPPEIPGAQGSPAGRSASK
jgi:molybdopterin synthase catalytic subunit/molybdopterin converting factor small subunit